MKIHAKIKSAGIFFFNYGSIDKIRRRPKKVNDVIIDIYNGHIYKQPMVVLNQNEYWMRDWVEQLNFLKIDSQLQPEKNPEHVCYDELTTAHY